MPVFEAMVSLALKQRKLAHANKQEALRWEAEGNHAFYVSCRKEANRLWAEAKWYLQHARTFRGAR